MKKKKERTTGQKWHHVGILSPCLESNSEVFFIFYLNFNLVKKPKIIIFALDPFVSRLVLSHCCCDRGLLPSLTPQSINWCGPGGGTAIYPSSPVPPLFLPCSSPWCSSSTSHFPPVLSFSPSVVCPSLIPLSPLPFSACLVFHLLVLFLFQRPYTTEDGEVMTPTFNLLLWFSWQEVLKDLLSILTGS